MPNAIRIQTKLDTSGLKVGLKDIETEIKNIQKASVSTFQSIQKEIDATNKEIERNIAESNKLEEEAQAEESKASSKWLTQNERNDAKAKASELRKRLVELGVEYEDLIDKRDALNEKAQIERQTAQEALQDKQEEKRLLEERLESINNTNKAEDKNDDNIKKHNMGLRDMLKKARGMGIALLGVQTAYAGIRKIIASATSDNEKLANTMQMFWYSLGSLFEPIINRAIQGLATIMNYLLSVIKAITGINILAKANAKMAKKSGGGKSNNLASFDKSEVLNKNGGGGNDLTNNYLKQVALSEKLNELAQKLAGFWERLKDITKAWIDNLDFSRLKEAFENVWDSLMPFIDILGEGLLWIYEHILLPIAKWFLESGIPAFLDIVAGALDVIRSVLELIFPIIRYAFENIIAPLAGTIGQMIETILEGIAQLLGVIAGYIQRAIDKLNENPELIPAIGTALGIIAGAFLVIKGAMIAIMALQFISKFMNPLGLAIAGVIALIVLLIENWDAWGDDFIDVINIALAGVEGFINFFIRGWNRLIDMINAVSIDLPDFLGGGHIGFNLKHTDEISLPRVQKRGSTSTRKASLGRGEISMFAQGGVFQPNAPFLGILGDQTRGRNIEAPEDLLRQIVAEEGGRNITLHVSADSTSSEFVRWLKFRLEEEDRRVGVSLVG